MNREEITVAGLIEAIESGERKEIRLRNWQIARLFGVFEQTVRANIKAVIRSGAVKPAVDCEVRQEGKILLPEVFDLEMIIALAFRFDSDEAAQMRKWILGKVIQGTRQKIIVFGMNNLQMLN